MSETDPLEIQRRKELQALLEDISGLDENHVHFQPPPNTQMDYSGNGAIRYSRDTTRTEFADNRPYRRTQRYQVTVISRKADNPVLAKIAALPMCTHDRWYPAENLNHDVFTLFF